MIVVLSYGLNPPVYIDMEGARVTQSRFTEEEIYIRIAKLAFHAKENPYLDTGQSLQSCIFIVQQSDQSI